MHCEERWNGDRTHCRATAAQSLLPSQNTLGTTSYTAGEILVEFFAPLDYLKLTAAALTASPPYKAAWSLSSLPIRQVRRRIHTGAKSFPVSNPLILVSNAGCNTQSRLRRHGSNLLMTVEQHFHEVDSGNSLPVLPFLPRWLRVRTPTQLRLYI